mmetsp:Transcript_13640/g.42685  ORF Transcript_13640/g.42685 Transcript_13640/m.42685 type:complete len:300 (-) Transcript_13640:533-1432(-)
MVQGKGADARARDGPRTPAQVARQTATPGLATAAPTRSAMLPSCWRSARFSASSFLMTAVRSCAVSSRTASACTAACAADGRARSPESALLPASGCSTPAVSGLPCVPCTAPPAGGCSAFAPMRSDAASPSSGGVATSRCCARVQVAMLGARSSHAGCAAGLRGSSSSTITYSSAPPALLARDGSALSSLGFDGVAWTSCCCAPTAARSASPPCAPDLPSSPPCASNAACRAAPGASGCFTPSSSCSAASARAGATPACSAGSSRSSPCTMPFALAASVSHAARSPSMPSLDASGSAIA